MKNLLKVFSVNLLIIVMFCAFSIPSNAQDTTEMVEQKMEVLKGDTWIKMSEDEKISFLWGAGHVVTIMYVLAQKYPDDVKDPIFIGKIAEARGNKPMTMNEVSKYVDDFYSNNPDKIDTPVVEVIWHETIEPNLTDTGDQ